MCVCVSTVSVQRPTTSLVATARKSFQYSSLIVDAFWTTAAARKC